MSTRAPASPRWRAVITAARLTVAVLVSGVLFGIIWLIVMQEGVRHGLMDHDFNLAMGQLLPGGGDPAHNGLRWTMVLSVGVAALYALAVEPLLARERWIRGVAYAVVPFLLWGLVVAPLAGSRLHDDPGGLFGVDGGAWAIAVGAVAATASTLVMARCYALMRSRRWWRPRELRRERAETLDALESSLELPEEGSEERRVGT